MHMKRAGNRRVLRDGVVAGTSPGMATEKAADSKPETLERTVLDNGLTSILATRGSETTGRRSHRGDDGLVETDGGYQQHHQNGTEDTEELGDHRLELFGDAAGEIGYTLGNSRGGQEGVGSPDKGNE